VSLIWHRSQIFSVSIMAWPWNLGYGSFKVIENGTIWNLEYGFIFDFHSKHARMFSRFDTKHERDGRTDTAGRHRPPLCRASHEKTVAIHRGNRATGEKAEERPDGEIQGVTWTTIARVNRRKTTVSLTAITISVCRLSMNKQHFRCIHTVIFYHAAAATPTTVRPPTVRRKSTRVKNKHHVGDELRWKHCTVRNSRWLTTSLPITGNFTHTLLASVQ